MLPPRVLWNPDPEQLEGEGSEEKKKEREQEDKKKQRTPAKVQSKRKSSFATFKERVLALPEPVRARILEHIIYSDWGHLIEGPDGRPWGPRLFRHLNSRLLPFQHCQFYVDEGSEEYFAIWLASIGHEARGMIVDIRYPRTVIVKEHGHPKDLETLHEASMRLWRLGEPLHSSGVLYDLGARAKTFKSAAPGQSSPYNKPSNIMCPDDLGIMEGVALSDRNKLECKIWAWMRRHGYVGHRGKERQKMREANTIQDRLRALPFSVLRKVFNHYLQQLRTRMTDDATLKKILEDSSVKLSAATNTQTGMQGPPSKRSARSKAPLISDSAGAGISLIRLLEGLPRPIYWKIFGLTMQLEPKQFGTCSQWEPLRIGSDDGKFCEVNLPMAMDKVSVDESYRPPIWLSLKRFFRKRTADYLKSSIFYVDELDMVLAIAWLQSLPPGAWRYIKDLRLIVPWDFRAYYHTFDLNCPVITSWIKLQWDRLASAGFPFSPLVLRADLRTTCGGTLSKSIAPYRTGIFEASKPTEPKYLEAAESSAASTQNQGHTPITQVQGSESQNSSSAAFGGVDSISTTSISAPVCKAPRGTLDPAAASFNPEASSSRASTTERHSPGAISTQSSAQITKLNSANPTTRKDLASTKDYTTPLPVFFPHEVTNKYYRDIPYIVQDHEMIKWVEKLKSQPISMQQAVPAIHIQRAPDPTGLMTTKSAIAEAWSALEEVEALLSQASVKIPNKCLFTNFRNDGAGGMALPNIEWYSYSELDRLTDIIVTGGVSLTR